MAVVQLPYYENLSAWTTRPRWLGFDP